MIKPKIYLAGPITGLTFDNCTEWRCYAAGKFEPEIDAFSPLRCKYYLPKTEALQDQYTDFVLSTQRGIYGRDFNDVNTCDLLFVNLLGAKIVSIGTVMEIAWGAMRRIPIVLVMEDTGNVHEHSMLREACPFRVNNLEDGIWTARAILLP